MSKIVGIYKIVSPTGSIYIGQSVDCEKRKETYSRGHCKSQPRLFNSIVKHGWDSHIFEIIIECEKSELSTLEKYYVDMYGTFNSEHGLNVRDGGGNCASISEEQKRKTSSTLKGVKHTPERIEKNRQAQTGKKLSEEHKANIKAAGAKPNLGKKASIETRQKISMALKGQIGHMLGKTHTEETKEKLRIAFAGANNPNFGLKRSDETKMKTSKALKGHAVSDETRLKISQKNTGKRNSDESFRKGIETRRAKGEWIVSDETKKKMSDARKGIKLSDETKLRISISKLGKSMKNTPTNQNILCAATRL